MKGRASNVLPVRNRQFRGADGHVREKFRQSRLSKCRPAAAGSRGDSLIRRSRRKEALLSERRMSLVTSFPTPSHADVTVRAPLGWDARNCRLQTGSTLRRATP